MKALVDAAVYSMVDDSAPPAEAILIDAGRIVAIGRTSDVIAQGGPGCEVVDARGQAIFPGFVDAHHHLSIAVFYAGCVPCGPETCPTIDALLAQLRAACIGLPDDAWVMAQGYDQLALRERRHPTRDELDHACGGRPVLLLHYSCHEGVASTRALELADIGPDTPDPPGGIIKRKRGRPTGRLIELSMSRVEAMARTGVLVRGARDYVARLPAYEARLFAAGITRIADPTVSPDFDALFRLAREEGKLRIPLLRMPISADGFFTPPRDRFGELRTGDGPEDFRVGAMKLFFDGANRCAMCMSIFSFLRTAVRTLARAVSDRSLDSIRLSGEVGVRLGPGLNVTTGLLFYEGAEGPAMVTAVQNAGYAVAIHANGNLGIARAIDAIATTKDTRGGALARIEHATFIDPVTLGRVIDVGAAVVVQPPFLYLPGMEQAPVPAGMTAIPLRSLVDGGVLVAGSSDAPVVTFDVLTALRAATTRTTASGRTIFPEEALDVRRAFALYTRNAAIACGALDVTGTLESGKRADLVVLSADPVSRGLDGIIVRETILAGETVYRAAAESVEASASTRQAPAAI